MGITLEVIKEAIEIISKNPNDVDTMIEQYSIIQKYAKEAKTSLIFTKKQITDKTQDNKKEKPLTFKFKKGNKIPYGQDFRFNKGIPHGIKFVVTPASTEMINLTGEGYGKTGNYGNGSLHVLLKDFPEEYVKLIHEENFTYTYGPF
jgi:hypothetical protein